MPLPAVLGRVSVWVAPTDRRPALLWLATGGTVAAALMAIFGLPPVALHGPLHPFGVMDPLCGATRGTVAVFRGDLVQAWRYNPASLLVPLGAAAALGRAAVGHLAGTWLDWRVRLHWGGWVIAAVVIATLWLNQQSHAALLR